MRVQFPAWSFNVEIPPGTKRTSLVTLDAGDGTREDFADWVNADLWWGNERTCVAPNLSLRPHADRCQEATREDSAARVRLNPESPNALA